MLDNDKLPNLNNSMEYHFEHLGNFRGLKMLFGLSEENIKDYIVESLKNNINKNNEEISACAELIEEFLNSKEPLYYGSLSRLDVVFDLYKVILRPKRIDQGNKNLCGPVSFATLWMERYPYNCVQCYFNLLQYGVAYQPLSLKAVPLNEQEIMMLDSSVFSEIFPSALKNASSTFGYAPYPRIFEAYRGITPPAMMCRWLAQAGFVDIKEATIVTADNKKELPWYYHQLTKIYDSKHVRFAQIEENFLDALQEFRDGKELIFLVYEENLSDINNKFDTVAGIIATHYINIKQLAYNREDKKISLTYWSRGNERIIREMDVEQFLRNYFGFISSYAPAFKLDSQLLRDV